MTKPSLNAAAYIAKLSDIEKQIADGALTSAASELNKLAKSSPNDPRLFILGAKLAEASGNSPGLLAAAKHAHELAPSWPVASLFLAQVLATNGESDAAMAMAEKSVQDASSQQTMSVDFLKRVATVAFQVGRTESAHRWLLLAEQLDANNLSIQYQLGLLDTSLGSFKIAISRFTSVLQTSPSNVAALLARMRAYLATEQRALAIADGDAVLALDPTQGEDVRFLLSLAHGETPQRQPNSIIVDTFANFPAGFDQKLVVGLNYKLPRETADLILQLFPNRDCDILDLGCGTGLLGACLGPMTGVVVGVDLSQAMINRAANHGVYDKFHRVDVADALKSTPESLYHIITALDVLGYVGALESIIANASRVLLPGGRFIFSCETAPADVKTFNLSKAYRFMHNRQYVEDLMKDSGFSRISVEDKVLRTEAGLPVNGFFVVAQTPATKPRIRKSPSA